MSDETDVDCLEHVWVLRGLTLGEGLTTALDYECCRCAALMVEGSYELTGRKPDSRA